jgi:hypothetical protein
MTGFDIERILRREGAPKGFAKAVAAACRAAGLFDRSHADKDQEMNTLIGMITNLIETIGGNQDGRIKETH